MHARSALFDLYGDHLRHRDGQAPVSVLLRLLGPLDLSAPAIRTAISRMVSQGWLEPIDLTAGPGYRATRAALRRFDDTAARVYLTEDETWDGTWHVVLAEPPTQRGLRERLRADLVFLGYAQVSSGAWLSPRARPDVAEVLHRAGVLAHLGSVRDLDPMPLDAWDLESLARAYAQWPTVADAILDRELRGAHDDDQMAFAARFHLVHEWRKFLFADPGLPRELLDEDWPGIAAAKHFSDAARRLKPASDRHLDSCLAPPAGEPAKLTP